MKYRKGQGMTEYIIIICLIAIACLLVIGVFGTNIRHLFRAANLSLEKGKAQKAKMESKGGEKDVRISDFTD